MVKYKGYLAVIGGILVHLTLGTLYSWGNINPYVTSYIRKHASPSTLRYSDTVWVFALMTTGQGLSMVFGGILEKRLGSRLATLIGSLLTSAAVLLSTLTVTVNYYLFLLTYGFMFGIGIGIAYAPPLAVAMRWFPDYKGVVNGFVVAGFGGGAFIFDQVQVAYLNPLNIKPVGGNCLNTTQDIGSDKYFTDETILSKVPTMFIVLGSCYAAMQVIGVILLFPADEGASDVKWEEQESLMTSSAPDQEDNPNSVTDVRGINLSPRQMITKRSFWTLWFMFLMNAFCVNFVSSLYKTYGESEVVNDDKFLTTLGSVAALCNSGGRILWGLFADKLSFKSAVTTLCASMTVLMGSLYITHLCADTAGRPLLFIWICLIFLTLSGNFSLFPTATAKMFGPQHVAVNYGVLFTSSAVAGPISALLSTLLLQKLHSYGIFILSACMSFVAFILALTLNTKKADGSFI